MNQALRAYNTPFRDKAAAMLPPRPAYTDTAVRNGLEA